VLDAVAELAGGLFELVFEVAASAVLESGSPKPTGPSRKDGLTVLEPNERPRGLEGSEAEKNIELHSRGVTANRHA
jgi:hypothetical protein